MLANEYRLDDVNILSKKSQKALKELEYYKQMLDEMINGKKHNLTEKELENCAIVSIILGNFSRFIDVVNEQKMTFDNRNSFLKYIKDYNNIIETEKVTKIQENIMQKQLRVNPPSLVDLSYAQNHPLISPK